MLQFYLQLRVQPSILSITPDNEICTNINYLGITTDLIKKADLISAQAKDTVLKPIYDAVKADTKPTRPNKFHRRTRIIKDFKKFKIKDGVLVLNTTNYGDQTVLPKEYHKTVYNKLHSKMSHLGSERDLELARQRFYWPCMAKDITFFIQKQCRDKTRNQTLLI